ncbi:MAG: hypothetical protein AAGA68_21145 [Pseudomonadota bacterium]
MRSKGAAIWTWLRRYRTAALGVLTAGALVACGGGGGGAAAPVEDAQQQLPPDNEAPVFSGVLAVQAQENTDVLVPVDVTDPDGDAITLSLAGEDAALFTVDALAVRANAPFDFEAPADGDEDNVYRFTVTASDGLDAIDLAFTVTVTNASDVAPDFAGSFDAAVPEGDIALLPFDVFDVDGDAVALSLEGADAALFTLDAEGLTVEANQAFDFELPIDADRDNVYEFQVIASDGLAATEQPFSVEVINISDNAPVFAGEVEQTSAENTAVDVPIEVTDADGDALTLTLGGIDAELFSLDPVTATVSADTPFDFEQPADADGDNVYAFSVTAFDGTIAVEQAFRLEITNVDEGPPEFVGAFDEVAAEGEVSVFTIQANDPDGGELTLTLGGADAAAVTFDSAASTVSAGPFDFEVPADVDGDNRYVFTMTAENDGGQTTTQAFSLQVLNVSDTPPVFSGDFDVTAQENVAVDIPIAVNDPDGDALTLELAGEDAALFTLNADGLTVTATAPFDFEDPAGAGGDNVYNFSVTASDGTVVVEQAYQLEITNVDEGAPEFVGVFDEAAAEGDVTVFTIEANDPDGDELTLTLGGADAAAVTFDALAGTVTAGPFDFEAPADVDGDNLYVFTLTAENDGGQSTTQAFSLQVLNVSDEAPEFSGDFDVTAQENVVVDIPITVDDPDGDVITLELAGEDAALFTLDADGLTVSSTAPFDFESPADVDADNVYTFTLTASDGVAATVQAFSLTVEDVAESALETLGAIALVAGQDPLFQLFDNEIVSISDLNADGRPELVVAAEFATAESGLDEAGRVTILNGASLAALTQQVTSASDLGPGDRVLIEGTEEELVLGTSLATVAGLDGDELPELVISSEDREVAVIPGVALRDALAGTGTIDFDEVGDGGVVGGALVRTTRRDDFNFGRGTTPLDDIDGDGISELFICANGANTNGGSRVGRGFVVFSSSLAATVAANGSIDLAIPDPLRSVVLDGERDDFGLCDTVASGGDVDGDGLGDVLVGVSPRLDDPGLDREAFLIFGATLAAERAADGLLRVDDALVASGGAIRFALTAPDDRADVGLAPLPDINGDGFDELLLGDRRADDEQGEAYLVFGSDTLGAANGGVVNLEDVASTVAGVVMRTDSTIFRAGDRITPVGDVDGDGRTDILISAMLGSGQFDDGRVFLVSGSELVDGAQIDLAEIGANPEEVAVLPARGVEISDIPHDFFSSPPAIAAAGDVDGDGLDDIAIGAEGFRGAVYLFSGGLLGETMGPGVRQQRLSIVELFPELAP